MKIGTMVYIDGQEELELKLQQLVKFGFDNCQLCSWKPSLWTDEKAAEVSELTKKYGISISAFWCGWEGPVVWDFYDGQLTLGLVPPEYRQMRIQNLCDGADFAKKLGVTDIITHMGFIPENPNDPNFAPFCVAVRTVAEHLKENGQYLLFETGQETPVTMLRCFEKVGCDNLGINLDTANLILYGRANPVDALDVFGKYVRNIHAKDGFYPTNGHSLGEEVRLGDGKVDFKAFFA
ncbi:MAG: sugar phosphate isomerase/epimerase, partial [Clostridia bacterium]|nr:sugar phosphate isomerase/epimerase [Clostridia bacterium]